MLKMSPDGILVASNPKNKGKRQNSIIRDQQTLNIQKAQGVLRNFDRQK
jgi:hypothetical protein